MTRTPILAAALAFAVGTPAVHAQDPAQQQQQQKTIVSVLEAQGNFTTFLEAVRAAGLEETLSGTDSYTVFAPTDEAFSRLPEGKLDELMADPAALRDLLETHIVAQATSTADITESRDVDTVEGSTIELVREGESVQIRLPSPAAEVTGGVEAPGALVATVITPDLKASNGVVHAIDRVLITPER